MSSLSRFKEALKPCTQSSSFFSGADTAASQSSAAAGSPPRPLRKPPKSTLSQQLQRLDLPASAKRPPRPPKPREEESESDDYRPPLTPAAPAVRDPFRAAPAGPFEPLILSDPGESPVIQVPASINCRLLEHQRHGVRFMYSLYRNNHGGVLGDDMMLDILEKFLIRKGYCFSRLDGSTPMNSRQSLVDEFNRSPSKQVFLISTRAGGLGLNLVSANRVVIFDPNWNPAQDLQAQDRSFRFGQTRHVIVFRLLGAGTLEELIYSRQVYKQQLSNIAVSGKMERRYFHGVQDCKEFKGELFGICNLFRDLSDKLFTNEIFESHVNDGQEYGHLHATETVGEHEMGSTIQTVLASENLVDHCDMMQTNVVSCSSKSNMVTKENESRRDDLGIVYAHRNEDVVNMGPGFQGKEEASMRIIDYIRTNINKEDRGEDMNDVLKKGKPLCKEEKLNEFKRFAEYMGMGVVEFSKWLLSASPSVRDEMLENYKKKKKREKHRDDG